jgi:predicted glycosyltransferase
VSCGGGSSALAFLRAAIAAFRRLAGEGAGGLRHLVVFAGAFVAPADLQALEAAAERAPIQIRRFGPEFDALLDGGALSVGRAGYNTCAALLRSRTRAVLAPDPVMSDQERRARRFADLGLARIVEGDPPGAEALGAAMRAALAGPPPRHDLDLDGLARTPALVAEWDRA